MEGREKLGGGRRLVLRDLPDMRQEEEDGRVMIVNGDYDRNCDDANDNAKITMKQVVAECSLPTFA